MADSSQSHAVGRASVGPAAARQPSSRQGGVHKGMLRLGFRAGYWTWWLHRASGVGITLFLFVHVVDTSLVGFGPDAYETFVSLYRSPFFRVLEVGLAAAVLFHGLNGVRIIVIDFWDAAARYELPLWYGVWASFVALFLPTAFFMLRPVFFPTLGLIR